jgi:endonuclease YncB( thermonuclease family)
MNAGVDLMRRGCRRWLGRAGIALAGATLVLGAPALADETELNRAVVVDGDTIQTPAGVFNLHGIDAPELGQRCQRAGRWTGCGKDAAFALHRLLGLALTPPDCTPVETGAGDGEAPSEARRVGTCALDGKQDLALVLLSQGLAMALPEAPVRYREAEESARAGGLGLWGTDFVRPRDWRRGGRLPDDPVEAPPPCPIKALIDDRGRRLYLVPLDPGYADIDEDAVAVRYCSDEAAEADGWHRPSLSDLLDP